MSNARNDANPRLVCEWSECRLLRWTPYSRRYCPRHFAENALRIDWERAVHDLRPIARMWARSRFSAVINGYEPGQGCVKWGSKVPMSHVLDGAELVGIRPDAPNVVSWRHAEAVVLEEAHSHVPKGSFYGYRLPATIPMKQVADLDDGTGTRSRTSKVVASVDEDYNGWQKGQKYAAEYYSSQLESS